MKNYLMIAFLLSIGIASPALAQDGSANPEEKKQDAPKTYLYQWIDAKGVAHITDGLGKVPKKYRSKAQRLESGAGEEPGLQQRKTPEPVYSEQEEREADLKEIWQMRVKAARKALADVEQHYRDIEHKKTILMQSIGGAGLSMGRQLDPGEIERLENELKQVQLEIDAAKQELEVTIPDEARKAGIPPGWLRD